MGNVHTDTWAVPILVNAEHYGQAGASPRVVKSTADTHNLHFNSLVVFPMCFGSTATDHLRDLAVCKQQLLARIDSGKGHLSDLADCPGA